MLNIIKAIFWAFAYHFGQTRKNSKIPYAVHPVRVAYILWKHGIHDFDILTAAILHDVFEDCNIDRYKFHKRFGSWVTCIVVDCTNRYTDGTFKKKTRHWRKWMEAKRIGGCSEHVQNIKIADAIDNLRTITKVDKQFAKIYCGEKSELIIWCRLAEPKLLESLNQQLLKTYGEINDAENRNIK